MNDNLYSLSVKKEFRARHFLTGGDWGEESKEHSHLYGLELVVAGKELDRHGFLIDIVELNALLEELVMNFEGKLLNEIPEFVGHNPSLERFCWTVHEALTVRLPRGNLKRLTVKLAEDSVAVAAYQANLT